MSDWFPIILGAATIVAGVFTIVNREKFAARAARQQARLGAIGRRTAQGATPAVVGVFGIFAVTLGVIIVFVSWLAIART
ncbi:MAG: hypothetical protein KF761_11055 [Salinibacterium sp.]|nr:hypothetical protein [Salinibacterium sp.]